MNRVARAVLIPPSFILKPPDATWSLPASLPALRRLYRLASRRDLYSLSWFVSPRLPASRTVRYFVSVFSSRRSSFPLSRRRRQTFPRLYRPAGTGADFGCRAAGIKGSRFYLDKVPLFLSSCLLRSCLSFRTLSFLRALACVCVQARRTARIIIQPACLI